MFHSFHSWHNSIQSESEVRILETALDAAAESHDGQHGPARHPQATAAATADTAEDVACDSVAAAPVPTTAAAPAPAVKRGREDSGVDGGNVGDLPKQQEAQCFGFHSGFRFTHFC